MPVLLGLSFHLGFISSLPLSLHPSTFPDLLDLTHLVVTSQLSWYSYPQQTAVSSEWTLHNDLYQKLLILVQSWHTTVVIMSVYDWRSFPGLCHDAQLTSDLRGVNSRCMSSNMTNSAIHPLGVDEWVVSGTQAFATRICIVAPPGNAYE